jgi:hypothetical protein
MSAKPKVYIINAGRSRVAVAMLVDALTPMTLATVAIQDVLRLIRPPDLQSLLGARGKSLGRSGVG